MAACPIFIICRRTSIARSATCSSAGSIRATPIAANIGFGFSLNPRFSYSLGYRHNYIFQTKSEIGDTIQRSNKLQVGQLNFGLSYRVTEKRTINLGFEFGVTEDAPDVSITLRSPLTLIR